MANKTQRVLKMLLRGSRVTALSAFYECHTMRLSAIIYTLKEAGIVTDSKYKTANGAVFKEYFIPKIRRPLARELGKKILEVR